MIKNNKAALLLLKLHTLRLEVAMPVQRMPAVLRKVAVGAGWCRGCRSARLERPRAPLWALGVLGARQSAPVLQCTAGRSAVMLGARGCGWDARRDHLLVSRRVERVSSVRGRGGGGRDAGAHIPERCQPR